MGLLKHLLRSRSVLFALAFLQVSHLLRYEVSKAIRMDTSDRAVAKQSEIACDERVSSHWLGIVLYLRCYPREFSGRLQRMQEANR